MSNDYVMVPSRDELRDIALEADRAWGYGHPTNRIHFIVDAIHARLTDAPAPPDTDAQLRAEVERLRRENEGRNRGIGEWSKAYHFVTDILPPDQRNFVRDPVCPMSLAEQDRHQVDVLIQRAEIAGKEVERLRAKLAALADRLDSIYGNGVDAGSYTARVIVRELRALLEPPK